MDRRTSGGQTPGVLPSGGGGSGNRAFAAPRGYALSGKIMLSAIVILFSVVLFVLFLHLYARYYLLRRAASRRRRSQALVFAAEGPVPTPPASLCGLDTEILKCIPVHPFSYSAHGGETESEVTECAVCLNEFEEGEKVRTLPRCRHGFHVECIDMWFHSHATCPLCRSAVAAVPPPPVKPDTIVVPISEEPPAPPAAAQRTDLQASCRHEDEGTSSSSRAVGLRVEVPARGPEGFIRRLDDEFGSPGGAFKSPGGRIIVLKRLWSRDLRSYRGADPDLERGEGAERVPATPRTTSQ